MSKKVVFVRDGEGKKIFNEEGLALVQNTADNSLLYVRIGNILTNESSDQQLKKQNLHSPKLNHITEASETSSRENCYSREDAKNEDTATDKANWAPEAIKALMAQYKDYAKSFQLNTKGHTEIWKKISSQLHACGYAYSHKQCENKFKNLKKRYHAKVDNMKSNQTGASPLRFDYFDIFHDLFARKPNVNPVALASSIRGSASLDILKAVDDAGIFDDDDDKENEASTTSNVINKRKRYTAPPTQNKGKRTKFEKTVDDMKKIMKEKMEHQDLRHESLLAAYERQTDRLVQSIDKLIDKL